MFYVNILLNFIDRLCGNFLLYLKNARASSVLFDDFFVFVFVLMLIAIVNSTDNRSYRISHIAYCIPHTVHVQYNHKNFIKYINILLHLECAIISVYQRWNNNNNNNKTFKKCLNDIFTTSTIRTYICICIISIILSIRM